MNWIVATLFVGGLYGALPCSPGVDAQVAPTPRQVADDARRPKPMRAPTQAPAEAPELRRFERTEVHMGTSFAIVLYASAERPANEALDAAMARIAHLDKVMSDYNPDSELSRLSAAAPTREPIPVSDDLWRVLEPAQRFARESDGAFDITVGPYTRLWRRSRRQKELPSDALLRSARDAVGHAHLVLEAKGRAVSLLQPNMRLDLGGIGQGYAADEALRLLRERGFPRALVNASGDIVCGDPPPGETGWKVGIAPLKPDSPPSRFFRLSHAAISTSGDAFQFVEIGGQRYSHIVDPRTGLGLTDRVSVSVLAPDGTTADALATAVCVLGPAQGLALVERLPRLAAVIVADRDGQTHTWESRRCREYQPVEQQRPEQQRPEQQPPDQRRIERSPLERSPPASESNKP